MDGHHKVRHVRRRFEPMVRRFVELQKASCLRINYESLHDMEDAQALLASADIQIDIMDANLHNADRELHELDAEIHAATASLRQAHNPNGKNGKHRP